MTKSSPSKISSTITFLKTDIWRIRTSQLSGGKSFWIKQLRIILLAVRGFAEDMCQLRASALTFYSLLSIVPVFAMAFGIAKGFGFEAKLEEQLIESMPGQEEVVNQIIGFSNAMLQNTQGGLIAGVGIAVLFWTVIKVLGNIEHSFNDIWGIKKPRSMGRKFSDYLSIMLICPILLMMSSSITVLIASSVQMILAKLAFLGPIAPLIIKFVDLLSYAVIWIMFTFIYVFMPNTKVNLKAGLTAGIIAGTAYKILQWAYITFQIGVSKYGAIYGSFAALPLFLIWLQLSWLVVLFGAEVSFSEQNVETYEFEPDCLAASHSFRRLVALRIVHLCVVRFAKGESPYTASEIAKQLELPIRLLRELIFELTEAGVLSEVKVNGDKTTGFQPARDIEPLSIVDVLDLLDKRGNDHIPVLDTKETGRIQKSLASFHDTIKKSSENVLLKDI